MKNILKLFCTDSCHLIRNVYAFVIVIGLCVLPSLYAWFNIYSNWDPYASTSNIRVAVASDDQGFKDDSGTFRNFGQEILDELKKNDKIGWVFTDSAEAKAGVYEGKYYAAVVIDQDFTDSMYRILQEDLTHPTIHYYENDKKNAVATKITDTAVSSLKQSINEKYIEVLASRMIADSQEMTEELRKDGGLSVLVDRLSMLSGDLKIYGDMIDKILEGNRTLESAASGTGALDSAAAGISGGKDALGSASAGLKTMQSTGTTLQDVTKNITQNQAEVQQDVKTLQADMEQLRNAADAATQSVAVTKASADLKTLHTRLDGMQTILQALLSDSRLTAAAKTRLSAQSDKVAAMQKKVQTMQDRIAALSVPAGVTADLQAMKQAADDNDRTLAEISALLQGDLTDETAAMEKSMQDMIDGTSSLLDSLQEELGQLNTLHQSLGSALDTSDASLEQIKEAVSMASARTDELLGALEDTEENGRLTLLSDFLSGDPAVYGQFFSEPVQITTKEIYPIANYGSAMTPFYTILALWVGALILTALIKVKADPESIPGIRHWQLFFGRYLLFFLLGQIQTAVVVLGNEYLLHCQILDPVRFWITAALASFVFTLIVYTLTISFGDIGKALAVVIMVIQIAGSGGTYPIELLPSIYRQIYIFFPFPYAINAMRETIGGSYGNTWQVSLLQLLIFAAVALVIGLLVRIPFIGLNSFVEKRMEDTELM